MTDTTITMRTYTRVANEAEQTVHVTIHSNGYIRMTADNLHHVLLSLGFTPTAPKGNA